MTEEVTNTESESDIVDGAETQAAPENLTLRELDQIAQIIDLGSQRGAFRAGEMATVGTLYNKLVSFLSYVQAQQAAAAEAAGEEGSEEAQNEGE